MAWTPEGWLVPGEVPIMVLLVDDQPIVAEALRKQFAAESGIAFHYCQDHEQAVTVAREIRPTTILLDLVLPGADGLDILRHLRADPATRDVPIIVLSVRESPETKAEAFAAGANDYLVKIPAAVETIARVKYHSSAHIARVQRDAAYRALAESQRRLEAANLELLRLATVDGLTSLSNRRGIDRVIEAEWRRGARDLDPLAVVLVDVDLFKGYNDSYGHLPGDDCLRAVAGVIARAARRPADLAGRFGGEEFLLVLPRTDAEGAGTIAEGVRAEVEALRIPYETSPVAPHVTVSAGVAALVPASTGSTGDLLSAADRALYRAKSGGRNRVAVEAMPQPVAPSWR